jgi:hypothetical protein
MNPFRSLPEDTQNLGCQFHEIHVHDRTPRMQDEIDACGQLMQMPAYGLAHAALDAIALMSFAQHLADSQPHTRTVANHCTYSGAQRSITRGKKPRHGGGKLLTGDLVNTLVISVLA